MAFGLCAIRRFAKALEDNTRSIHFMASKLDALNAKIDTITSAISTVASDLQTVLADDKALRDKLANGETVGTDEINAVGARLDGVLTSLQAIHSGATLPADTTQAPASGDTTGTAEQQPTA